jgi:hypothetical protein
VELKTVEPTFNPMDDRIGHLLDLARQAVKAEPTHRLHAVAIVNRSVLPRFRFRTTLTEIIAAVDTARANG